jgi:preprotein translocase subunit YajC
MVSKNKNILYLLFIFILIFIFVIVNKNLYKNEYFENNINYIQSGAGILNSSGTITFQQPFGNIPSVFIQANNGSSSSVVINTKNITNTGFSYIKNLINETTSGSFTTLVMQEDKTNTFNWVAIDTANMNNSKVDTRKQNCCNVCDNSKSS